ncbi:LOW QUALITY PROTEIN: hypothetical protein DAPK24_005040 [Pichia kluyveri]|uniref:Uncharacterized protein n=1 Tax=Pichia kluyveri TaxID=36015 RepID=A0AAV5QXL4_PICKL|nr:LOW QUALITY PROTEIN: hypothetical protein DAPK24_005040 [Pichia kluyveri]
MKEIYLLKLVLPVLRKFSKLTPLILSSIKVWKRLPGISGEFMHRVLQTLINLPSPYLLAFTMYK